MTMFFLSEKVKIAMIILATTAVKSGGVRRECDRIKGESVGCLHCLEMFPAACEALTTTTTTTSCCDRDSLSAATYLDPADSCI